MQIPTDQDAKPNVGQKLRLYRERQGWSLRILAERCGLSINAISRIERGENSPTVSSLHRLASALSIPITDFFSDDHRQSASFVKSGSGQIRQREGFTIEHLNVGLANFQLAPFLFSVEPFCQNEEALVSHPGEEFVHCLAGEVEYLVDNQVYNLHSGDSLLFEAVQRHSWRNPAPAPALLLVIFQASQDNSLARLKHRTG